jgi:NitT/TauT family transport system substrate-binding protein
MLRRNSINWLSLLFLLALVCGQLPQSTLAQDTLKLGYIPIADHAPTFAAIQNGYFTQQGIKAKLTPMAGGAVIIPAVAGGSLDIGYAAHQLILVARERGMDFTIVAPNSGLSPKQKSYVQILVREDSPIRRPKDFEGRIFSVNTLGAIDWLYAAEWVTRNGANQKKVHWLELPFPKMGAALRAKKIDGMYGVEPFITIEMGRGGLRIVGDPFSEVDPHMVIAGWTTTETWAKAHPQLLQRFVSAFYKGIDYSNENPEKVAGLLSSFTRIPAALAPKLRLPVWAHPMDMKALQRTADLTHKWGLIEKRPDVRKAVWPTALQ